MKKILLFTVLAAIVFNIRPVYAGIDFDNYFHDKTLRFDYYHTGNATEEHFAFDQIVNDGVWAGSKTQLIDELRLGKYFFEIVDITSGRIIYSRGFCSIYGEWETTGEAKENWGVNHESLRFPWPKKEVKINYYKRNDDQKFEKIWEHSVNIDTWRTADATVKDFYKTVDIVNSGDPCTKVDIVVLSEGYTSGEMDKFRKDAKKFAETLLSVEPFASRKDEFNIRAVEVPSPVSGVHHPHQDIHTRSALSVRYGAFGSQRYALGFDNKKIRDASSAVPYDFTVILMNDSIYGGGGIYNLFITAAADNAFNEYLFVHEFGHHFADLADEYYTSSTAYEMGSAIVEPHELNVTTYTEKDKIKWGEMIEEGTPLPTPWGQEEFDEHSIEIQKKRKELRDARAEEKELEDLFMKQRKWEDDYLGKIEYAGKTGLYEGGMYHSKGIYRSAPGCIMFIRTDYFCPACRRAINLVIDQYVK